MAFESPVAGNVGDVVFENTGGEFNWTDDLNVLSCMGLLVLIFPYYSLLTLKRPHQSTILVEENGVLTEARFHILDKPNCAS